MAIKKPARAAEETVEVLRVEQGEITAYVLGTSPLILNRMPEKAWRELLAPLKKSAADKAANAKHDPMAEFRASPYRMPRDNDPTLIAQIGSAFKKAIAQAAIDMPGSATKAQMGRLTFVPDQLIAIYGTPQIFCSIVRSADQNKTPDVRTRCIVPKWAAKLRVRFVKPMLKEQPVVNLLAAAGVYCGVGDWRPEKGAGSFGQFELVSADDERFAQIIETGGRAAQIAAMADPDAFDSETQELLDWFGPEMKRRGFKVAA